MSQSITTTDRRTRRLSHRARAGVLGGTGLAAAVAATLVVSGAAGASAAADQPITRPASIVEEGSGASDAVGTTSTDPATGVTVIDGHMLIAPQPQVVQDTSTVSGGATGATGDVGAVPTDLHTVAPGADAASSVERDVVSDESIVPAPGLALMVAEGSDASGVTEAGPDAGV